MKIIKLTVKFIANEIATYYLHESTQKFEIAQMTLGNRRFVEFNYSVERIFTPGDKARCLQGKLKNGYKYYSFRDETVRVFDHNNEPIVLNLDNILWFSEGFEEIEPLSESY
jgi:hypothetical protein